MDKDDEAEDAKYGGDDKKGGSGGGKGGKGGKKGKKGDAAN